MCGIAGIFGHGVAASDLQAMLAIQHHRGPDGSGCYVDPTGVAGLAHNRLSIIDLSDAGQQPMASADGRFQISFNGEIYNYIELKEQLADYPYRSRTDTEVVLAAYQRWGERCLDRLIGMFAFLIWDQRDQRLFAARDRFGVKPLYYARRDDGALVIASEIRTLRAAGVATEPNPKAWASYLARGVYEHSEETFFQGVYSLPPGHQLIWRDTREQLQGWYDLADRSGADFDQRPETEVMEEYFALLQESTRLRFRADVPVGINLSGGLDSSALLGLVQQYEGDASKVKAFTFVTGDPRYDEPAPGSSRCSLRRSTPRSNVHFAPRMSPTWRNPFRPIKTNRSVACQPWRTRGCSREPGRRA